MKPGESAERVPLVAVSPAFEDVYRARYRPLLKLAFVLSGSQHAAEDVVQEAFLAAYGKWESVSRYEYPEAWLRRVVVNKGSLRDCVGAMPKRKPNAGGRQANPPR